ncbi:MAG: hypothetical protein AAB778_00465 [Patescibacteria group bacterium]
MSKKTKDLIVFVERNSLILSGNSFEKPIKLVFNKEVFSDLEIVDKKVFVENISAQFKNKEVYGNLIIVFSDDTCFVNEIPINSTQEQIEVEEKRFISLMPFDKVIYKLIKFTNSYKLIGINSDIYLTIEETLAAKGFSLLMVLPKTVIPNFDLNSVIPESLKVYSLVETNNGIKTGLNKTIFPSKKNYLSLLVGVFIFLLVILAILIVRRG